MFSLEKIPNQEPNEKGIMLLRRHWFTFLLTLLLYAVLSILPFFVLLVIWPSVVGVVSGTLTWPLFIIILSIYYLSIWTFLFHAFVDFYLDVWVITNERIINIEQKGLFSRVVAEQRLFRVQDVTAEIKGFFPTLLKYGNLYIQTAGQEQRFIFKNVPDPDEIVQIIHESVRFSKQRHPREVAEAEKEG